MKRGRRQPLELCDLLPRLAREAGAERLRRTALDGSVRRALGPWLGERLLSCRREGNSLELEMAGAAAAREVEALSGELLRAVAGCFGPNPPRRLRVVVGAAAPVARSAPLAARQRPTSPPGEALREALSGIEDPVLREQLARIAARATT